MGKFPFYMQYRVIPAMAWVLTRALMLTQIGYLRAGAKISYEDVEVFRGWAERIVATHMVPGEPAWQYPPAAVLIFLLPRLAGVHYGAAFAGVVLVADIVTAISLVILGQRYGTTAGAWLWILLIPMLGTLPLLRFDVIPTCLAVLALTLLAQGSQRRFGFLVGLGASVKAWPVLLLLACRERRTARRATLAAAVTGAVIAALGYLALPNSLSFLIHQSGRGLELESVAATPWYLRQAITGQPVQWVARNGSLEIVSAKADALAHVLFVGLLMLGAALVLLWFRATRGRTEVAAETGSDLVFTAVLLFVVGSEVLSPQYLIWLVGLGAVALSSPGCLVRRPIASVVVAVIVTRALLAVWGDLVTNGAAGAYLLSIRNGVLVFAACDAAVTMVRSLIGHTRPGRLPSK